jgi:hypothetical protein
LQILGIGSLRWRYLETGVRIMTGLLSLGATEFLVLGKLLSVGRENLALSGFKLIVGHYFSSLVVDHLSTTFAGENVFVAFLYCDYRDREQQSAVNLIGGLLKQALVSAKKAPEEIIGSLSKVKKERKSLELSDTCQALSLTLQTFDRVYLCIDALDECDEGHRGCFIDCIQELVTADIINSQPIKLFFTARPQIKDYIVTRPSISSLNPLSMTLEANSGDIATYVTDKLEKDTRVKMEDEFKRTIVAEIVASSEGM